MVGGDAGMLSRGSRLLRPRVKASIRLLLRPRIKASRRLLVELMELVCPVPQLLHSSAGQAGPGSHLHRLPGPQTCCLGVLQEARVKDVYRSRGRAQEAARGGGREAGRCTMVRRRRHVIQPGGGHVSGGMAMNVP